MITTIFSVFLAGVPDQSPARTQYPEDLLPAAGAVTPLLPGYRLFTRLAAVLLAVIAR